MLIVRVEGLINSVGNECFHGMSAPTSSAGFLKSISMRNPLQVKPTFLCCVLRYVLHAKSFHLFLDEDVDVFSPTAEDSPFSRAFSRRRPIGRSYSRKKLLS